MFPKSIWIPILIVVLAVIGCGLFYAKRTAEQEPVNVYKPVEVEQPSTPKPPPPGETAESGHWHDDVWHSEPHDTSVEAQQSTDEAQDARAIAQQVNAQTDAPMPGGSETSVPSVNLSEPSPRMQEALDAFKASGEWRKKHKELREALSRAAHESIALSPGTEEELKRFEKDPEWQRKYNEANAKMAKIDAMLRAHEEKRPTPLLQ